jgi:hypothetical protein
MSRAMHGGRLMAQLRVAPRGPAAGLPIGTARCCAAPLLLPAATHRASSSPAPLLRREGLSPHAGEALRGGTVAGAVVPALAKTSLWEAASLCTLAPSERSSYAVMLVVLWPRAAATAASAMPLTALACSLRAG